MEKGKTILAKITIDTAILKDTANYDKNEEAINRYYADRIKASYCFRNANGLYFSVLNKQLKKFWKAFKDDKESLNLIIKVENASYDSLIQADNLRGSAEKKYYIDDRIPLVTNAEHLEENALLKLQKVLYIYLNWPKVPNLAWLFSEDKYIPVNNKDTFARLSNIPISEDSLPAQAMTVNSTAINSLHIAKTQEDNFQEFQTYKPASQGFNYQKIYNDVIDSVHKEWHEYLANAPAEVIASEPLIEKYEIAGKDSGSEYIYTIQIAACRVQISPQELRRLWDGTLPIRESQEEGWYKYTIGTFNTDELARQFLNSTKNSKFFIAVYKKNKRIRIIIPH